MCGMSSTPTDLDADDKRKRLRRTLRERRRGLAPTARITGAQALAARLLALPFAPEAGHVAGYWAMDGEIALHAWQLALPPGAVYCLPVLHDTATLRFAPWRPGSPLTANRYGIPEPDVAQADLLLPQQMRLVVTPLVGFDARGGRLGMGAAWYDRSFAFRQDSPPPPWLVGAAFAFQQVDSLVSRPWDVALDAICTDQTVSGSRGTYSAARSRLGRRFRAARRRFSRMARYTR